MEALGVLLVNFALEGPTVPIPILSLSMGGPVLAKFGRAADPVSKFYIFKLPINRPSGRYVMSCNLGHHERHRAL